MKRCVLLTAGRTHSWVGFGLGGCKKFQVREVQVYSYMGLYFTTDPFDKI